MAKKSNSQKTTAVKLGDRKGTLDGIVSNKYKKTISRHRLILNYIDKGIQKDTK